MPQERDYMGKGVGEEKELTISRFWNLTNFCSLFPLCLEDILNHAFVGFITSSC